ncbi:unnamed protein product, partial [Cyprideis torosa]
MFHFIIVKALEGCRPQVRSRKGTKVPSRSPISGPVIPFFYVPFRSQWAFLFMASDGGAVDTEKGDALLQTGTQHSESIEKNELVAESIQRRRGSTSSETAADAFECAFCMKLFDTMETLEQHCSIHLPEFTHQCCTCGRRIDQNIDSEARTSDESLQCTACEGIGNTRSRRKDRRNDDFNDKPFQCNICGERFRPKKELDMHLKIHFGERPFECFVCGKFFRTRRDLKRHGEAHSKEMGCQCTVCGKRYKRKGYLKKHLTIHTGEKNFKCTVCEKKFRDNTKLEIHSRVHSGERPFECVICKRTFANKANRDKHA